MKIAFSARGPALSSELDPPLRPSELFRYGGHRLRGTVGAR